MGTANSVYRFCIAMLISSFICVAGGSLLADEIWVNSQTGVDDLNTTGTYSDPFLTIRYAMDHADTGDGDTIMLFAGMEYRSENADPAGEENWPIAWKPNVSIEGEDPEYPSVLVGLRSGDDNPEGNREWECILRPYYPDDDTGIDYGVDPGYEDYPGKWDNESDPAKTRLENLIFRYGGCQICTRYDVHVSDVLNQTWGVNVSIKNVRFEKSSNPAFENYVATKPTIPNHIGTCNMARITFICEDCEFSDQKLGIRFIENNDRVDEEVIPEFRVYLKNCTFGCVDGIPAFDGTDDLWNGGGKDGYYDQRPQFWGTDIWVHGIADMDIIVNDCKFYGLDASIVNGTDPGCGRHHHRYAIAAELKSYGESEERVDADLALSIGSEDDGKTVIERGYVVDGSGNPDSCEFGACKHGIHI